MLFHQCVCVFDRFVQVIFCKSISNIRHLFHSWSDSDALPIELVVIYFGFVPFDFILVSSHSFDFDIL